MSEEIEEKAKVIITTFESAINNGYKHYRKSTGELLSDTTSILKALIEEKSILIEPPTY